MADLRRILGRIAADKESVLMSNTAAAVLTAGLWVIFSTAILSGHPLGSGPNVWVLSSSDKTASHPTLVRAAAPPLTANLKAALLVRP